MNAAEYLRRCIQKILDDGDGWQVDQFVICLGLERIVDGRVESTPWVWSPPEQPDWQTDGLMRAAWELRCDSDVDSD